MFDDPEPPELNRSWIEELAQSANSSGGIMLVAEHIEDAPGPSADDAPQTVQVSEAQIAPAP